MGRLRGIGGSTDFMVRLGYLMEHGTYSGSCCITCNHDNRTARSEFGDGTGRSTTDILLVVNCLEIAVLPCSQY